MNRQLPLTELLDEILPRLATLERLTRNSPGRETLALELHRIRLNIESLLHRHADAVVAAREQGQTGMELTLDHNESAAIASARQLCRRAGGEFGI